MINDYEISITGEVENSNDYEEITVEEFLNRELATEEEKNQFCRTYKAINIHFMISKQTIKNAYEVCDAMKNDPRLAKMNAIVFLGLKPKERGQAFDVLPTEEFVKLVNYCLENGVRFGFDSCSCCRFLEAVNTNKTLSDDVKTRLLECAEPCESGLFSAYVDAAGKYWHCSFGENRDDAGGVDLTKTKNFVEEVWLSKEMNSWRETLKGFDRECPLYPEIRVKHKL